MKKTVLVTFYLVQVFITQAQVPAGFVNGAITFANDSTVQGYIKDNIKKNASVVLITADGHRQNIDGCSINSIIINGAGYRCFKGDFFKEICTGKICFLQKCSDASGKASYNGAEAIFVSGTPGKLGDYFLYSDGVLNHINKKSVESLVNTTLTSCLAAAEKAKAINGNFAALAEAVAIYNTCKN